MSAFNLVTNLRGLNGAIRSSLAHVGGAKSPEMRGAANVLAKHQRKTLSVSGGARVAQSITSRRLLAIGGTPSAPGTPPHAQTKQFAKSVKVGVVGTGIRVGPLRFTGLMLEEGVNATAGARKQRNRSTVRQKLGGRRQLAGKVQRTVKIAARPYLLKAVESAKDEMATVFGDLAGLSITAGK
jgi:hypothetical protein